MLALLMYASLFPCIMFLALTGMLGFLSSAVFRTSRSFLSAPFWSSISFCAETSIFLMLSVIASVSFSYHPGSSSNVISTASFSSGSLFKSFFRKSNIFSSLFMQKINYLNKFSFDVSMAKRYAKDKQKQKEIARQRIRELFDQAKKMFSTDPKLSDRYVRLAKKLSMKYKVRIPQELRRRMCKHCLAYLVPDKTSQTRTKEGKVVIHCLRCGGIMRVPYLRERKARRKAQYDSNTT
ncbi:hypothetical protein GF351_03440 [Candidatus Woesearchaeota archaeon]|nr:hypothetical protein [Candidatus Woesearchaeota archaeon]